MCTALHSLVRWLSVCLPAHGLALPLSIAGWLVVLYVCVCYVRLDRMYVVVVRENYYDRERTAHTHALHISTPVTTRYYYYV